MTDTISIPVTATMAKQPDGTYKMIEAEYVDIDVAVFVRFLAGAFGIREVNGQ